MVSQLVIGYSAGTNIRNYTFQIVVNHLDVNELIIINLQTFQLT